MSSESRDRISGIYHAALQCAPESRRAFLQEACAGDEALRQEVESLLGYDALSSEFLERPAGAIAIEPHSVTMVNRQLGPYRIIAPLGAGGMGEVYRARQQARSRRRDQDPPLALHR